MRTLLAVVLAQLLSCGGGGGDDTIHCDNNDCTTPGRTTVEWIFDAYPALLFPDDSCGDMGASMVQVVATQMADATVTQTMTAQCGDAQVIFLGLPAGSYTIAVTPLLDFNGAPLVTAAATGMVVGGQTGADTEITINVPYTAWNQTYTGTFFFFRLPAWNGKLSCEAATPVIATQTLTLTAGGQITTQLTDTNQKLDGTDPEACRKLSEGTAQSVQNVPFGPATFIVVGKDSAGTVQFSNTFPTFVGAGKSNPEIDFDLVDAGSG